VDGFEPNGTGCDDEDVCTAVDQCQDGACVGSGTVCGNGVAEPACGEECDPPDAAGACPDDECIPPGQPDECTCRTPIGAHKCTFDPNNSTIKIDLQAFPLFYESGGSIDIDCGTQGANGKAPCECDLQSFSPIFITNIGFICFSTGTEVCPTGEIDCDGGNPLDTDMDSDHNIGECTSSAQCEGMCSAHCAGLVGIGPYTVFNDACEGL
jgi:hypothetical protein